jgi:hypothetical protein
MPELMRKYTASTWREVRLRHWPLPVAFLISVAALRFDLNRLNRVSIGRQPIKEGSLPISLFVLFVPYSATHFRKGWNLYKKMQSPLDAKCGFVTDRYQVPFYQQIMASVNWAIQITFIRLSIIAEHQQHSQHRLWPMLKL